MAVMWRGNGYNVYGGRTLEMLVAGLPGGPTTDPIAGPNVADARSGGRLRMLRESLSGVVRISRRKMLWRVIGLLPACFGGEWLLLDDSGDDFEDGEDDDD
ncbi:hypothetical protein BU26DRAFT_511359 [Trematosphaeria pertusa]|uniref:Uncharacterized protein n=1 Tax=Trematosphaeria pertusa TaxID=390896 RepID=A0A6A6HTR4_9PLEO|nr:uncharacterized protein BU26DRAFT_511359 [Trematosphaeria pertusa]KAF2241574.1 hypothetical protein BU26DRAFT_511359 [Trematosphaeria pertusa]